MVFYLVIYEAKKSLDVGMISFNSKEKAIGCASQIASTGFFESSSGDTYVSNAILVKIIRFNANSLKGVSCQLALNNGRFELKENKPTKNS